MPMHLSTGAGMLRRDIGKIAQQKLQRVTNLKLTYKWEHQEHNLGGCPGPAALAPLPWPAALGRPPAVMALQGQSVLHYVSWVS